MASAVRFFLARALTPHVQAGSRWTAVNAASRRAFVVGGKDTGSAFLRWLADGRPSASREFDDAAAQLGIDVPVDVDGFLGWYRQLNYDYPFLDYAADDGRRVDVRLMDAYSASTTAEVERAPSTRSLSSKGVDIADSAHPPEEPLLGAWLQATAGYKEISPGRRGPVRHRTSPSGGARHPTELGVALHTGWGTLAGQWLYDPLTHGLAQSQVPYVPDDGAPPNCAVFSLISRVSRAMWRYRDVRAFRPVLYDAGHVIETLLTVIQLTGWPARWVPAPSFLEDEEGDIAIGYVIAGVGESSRAHAAGTNRGHDPSATFRTTPYVSLAFDHGHLVATNHLEPERQIAATGPMVDALAYSTPSSRRDRPTDASSLKAATSLAAEELDLLRRSGLLLEEDYGDNLWRRIAPWSKHDWYLSSLVHAEAVAMRDAAREAAFDDPAPACDTRVVAALDHRRTARSLRADPLPGETVSRMLRVLRGQREITVVLSTPAELGAIPRGVHVLTADAVETLQSDGISDEEVARAAIGQPWARGFTCAIWLLPAFTAGTAADWETHMVQCGRLAQRLTLAVSHEPSVGVFQSPAMIDAELSSLLCGRTSLDGAYLVGIGISDGRDATSRERMFRVRELLRGGR